MKGLVSVANRNTISEVTEVAALSTGTVVGLTVRGDEASDAPVLQIDSKHKQTRQSYYTISHNLPAKCPSLNLYMYYTSQELPRKNKLQLLLHILLYICTNYTTRLLLNYWQSRLQLNYWQRQTIAQLLANQTIAQLLANQTIAQLLANQTIAQLLANQTIAQLLANQTIAQLLANQTIAQLLAKHYLSQEHSHSSFASRRGASPEGKSRTTSLPMERSHYNLFCSSQGKKKQHYHLYCNTFILR